VYDESITENQKKKIKYGNKKNFSVNFYQKDGLKIGNHSLRKRNYERCRA